MPRSSVRTVSWVVPPTGELDRLRDQVNVAAGLVPGPLATADLIIVWHELSANDQLATDLVRRAEAGARVLLAGPTLRGTPIGSPLSDGAGLLPGDSSPGHEVRIRPGAASIAPVVPPGTLPHERILLIDKVVEDVEVLLTANVRLAEHPVASYRPNTGIGTFILAGGATAPSRDYLRLFLQILRHLTDSPGPRALTSTRVGLLGYGAIGAEHRRALAATSGLELGAVCDRSADRRNLAATSAPDVAVFADPEQLLGADIDLLVVSTPPDSHAYWAMRAVDAGMHVVVEKPFALTTADADEVLDFAHRRGRLAVVYQNRRFDPDHLAIKRLVTDGRIGRVFRAEAFIGGYGHPCNFWHSDEQVSGGAVFDWGAHVLDQLLDLVPGDVATVAGAEHKLVWHDVSNADHSRVTVTLSDGAEIEFTHSDIAAALKPRWYVLGTEGAIVGDWRTESVIGRSEIGVLSEDRLAPADSPPQLKLLDSFGSTTDIRLPHDQWYGFHQELADFLRWGIPMSVTGEQSRRVLAVMEAARRSAQSCGQPMTPA